MRALQTKYGIAFAKVYIISLITFLSFFVTYQNFTTVKLLMWYLHQSFTAVKT